MCAQMNVLHSVPSLDASMNGCSSYRDGVGHSLDMC